MTLSRILRRLLPRDLVSTAKVVALLALCAGLSAVVAHSVAQERIGRGEDLLRPAAQLPRQTTRLGEQTLRPTVAGDGAVVQVNDHFEINATIQNTD